MSVTVGPGWNIGPGWSIGSSGTLPASLVLSLDATSYSGSGSTWPATTGSNATLIGVPGYTASAPTYLSFDPLDVEYASVPNLGDLNTWTIEAWFRATASLAGQITTVVCNEFDLVNKLNFSIGTNNAPGSYNIAVGFFDGSGWHNTSGFVPTQNVWYQVVGTYDGATIKQYVNGVFSTQLSYAGTPQSGGEVRIARRWDSSDLDSGNFFPGDIAIVKIYNGDIGADGVTTNWNANKARFGL